MTFAVTTGSLVVGQTALSFKQASGGAPPVNQAVGITSTGQPLNFAASAYNSGSVSWLKVTPSGSTPGSISVGVDGSKLPQGTYTGTVTLLATIAELYLVRRPWRDLISNCGGHRQRRSLAERVARQRKYARDRTSERRGK